MWLTAATVRHGLTIPLSYQCAGNSGGSVNQNPTITFIFKRHINSNMLWTLNPTMQKFNYANKSTAIILGSILPKMVVPTWNLMRQANSSRVFAADCKEFYYLSQRRWHLHCCNKQDMVTTDVVGLKYHWFFVAHLANNTAIAHWMGSSHL